MSKTSIVRPAVAAALAALVTVGVSAAGASSPPAGVEWPAAGHDLWGTRNNQYETTINTGNVASLGKKWSVDFPGALTSTPAVAGGVLYQPDAAGNLKALNAATGATIWTHTVGEYTGHAGDVDHATPSVASGRLVFGVRPGSADQDGASVIAVSTGSGAKLWRTVVDSNPISKITGGVLVSGNIAFVGVSSSDEGTNPCGCTFRGSLVALDVRTGKILWKTYTVPQGYTGGAIFGAGPIIDHTTGLVFAGTGNNYSVPSAVCGQPNQTGCTAPVANDHFDSLLAFQASTGKIVWALPTRKADASTIACRNTAVCGPDFGFASAANFIHTKINGMARTLVGIGEKSGIYYAADARTGSLLWKTQVGPGGTAGGIQWGSAFDGKRIYSAIVNSNHETYVLKNGQSTTGGAFSALDPATGKILWQTADPQGVGDFGYVSSANGVVYAGSSAVAGTNMYALNAATGAIAWSYASGGSVMGGAAIVQGAVYWPAGYYSKTCPGGATSCQQKQTLYSFAG